MNADLKRVREAGVDDDTSPAKRRALGLATPPPPDNGDDDRLEDWQRVVEVKRKEAIYRQMLEYRRLHQQEAKRADELEAQKKVLEASVQAVEVCWTQLVNAIRDLSGRQETEVKQEVEEPIIDPQLSTSELDQALQTRLPMTQQLITHFVDLASKNGVRPATDELHSKCSRLQAESSVLRSSSRTLKTQISSLTESRETLQRDLQRAQKALDKQRMEHDKAERDWKSNRERERDSATPGIQKPANGSGHATPNGKIEEESKPFDNVAGPSGLLQDTAELEEKAEVRLKQLEALRSEHMLLRQEHDRLRLLATHPSEAALRESPFFQIYLQQLSANYNRANELQQRYQGSEKKLDELRNNNYEFREAVLAEARTETEALRQQMAKKDADLARLRGQRDEAHAELTERKAGEVEKMRFADEAQSLASARQERIVFLTSEVRRLKGKLGAESGSEQYLAFLREDGGIDGDYVKDLERKLSDAESKISALSAQISGSSDPESSSAAKVRAELEIAKKALNRYEKVLGPNPEAAEDVKLLADKLSQTEAERARLALQLQEAEAATNALYTEVDGLAKLWESLEKTCSSKVFELKDGEMKMSRLATEKAKADNKYFQAMRTKEAIEAECRTAQRSVEKQLKLLERAQEVEKGLNAQISTHEKGLTALKNAALEIQTQLAGISSEKSQLELRLSQAQASLTEAQQLMHQRVADHANEKATREKLQEEVDSNTRTIKKLKERQEAISAAGGQNVTANEWELKQERDKLWGLLRCSCCNQGFKQQVITRCMHTFCKNCLDQRIASRQRKCPACGIAFSKEEVQTLYWQ